MHTLHRIAASLVLTMPACALAGTPAVAVSEPSLISLLAVGGIALAFYSKFRKK